MATFKLYPPTLAGTTPPFYKTGTGTYILRVPFTMNKMVSASEVGGVKLRIRAADTDLEIGRLNAQSFALSTDDSSYAEFNLEPIKASIQVGKFYKLQLAYIDNLDSSVIGYYSTISITKCTAQPVVSILGLDEYSSNVDITSYTGFYSNINDPSEKCYQYKFTLYDSNGEILDTTGWTVHNANTDDSSTESKDEYILNYTCLPSEKYSLQYSVITNNNLTIESTRYLIVGATSVAPELKAHLKADLDYDNGCVRLYLEPFIQTKQQMAITTYNGQFVITRSSSKENFKRWTKILTFTLNGTLPTGQMFADFTVEQGQTYRYALQQFNDNKIYSSRVYTDDVYTVFEDMFLFDGERQLRIRFNPKVSSFKTVLQDSKKNTLGSKYPFFFRNGNVAYKEFPISGLISYMIDDNEYFLSKTKDLGMPIDWQDTTDIIDDNIAYERKFKLEVLDWLNDGNIKLFRSPGEGNYLVRLTNVQLTPNDSLSRMIHTFQCTADEIDAFSTDKLIKYGFLKVSETAPLELRFGTINFNETMKSYCEAIYGSYIAEGNYPPEVIDQAVALFASKDLLNGRQCSYLKFENCLPNHTWFTLGGQDTYVIGATGSYEHQFETPVSVLNIKDPYYGMDGEVTYGIWTTQTSTFDTVNNILQQDVIASPTYTDLINTAQDVARIRSIKEERIVNPDYNYINQINNTKDRIQRFYGMHFYLNDLVYEMTSLETFCDTYNLYLDRRVSSPLIYQVCIGLSPEEYNAAITAIEQDAELTNAQKAQEREKMLELYTATQSWSSAGSTIHSFVTDTGTPIETNTILKNNRAKAYSDILVDNALFIDLSNNKLYKYNAENYTFEEEPASIAVTITHYDKNSRTYTTEIVNLTPTQICIDNDIIDIGETGSLDVPDSDHVPTQLQWGSCVSCTLVYQLLTVCYGVESQIIPGLGQTMSLSSAWKAYSDIAKIVAARQLKLKRLTTNAAIYVRNIPDGDYDECSYFVWDADRLIFKRLSRDARAKFNTAENNEVWVPWPYTNNNAWVPSGVLTYKENQGLWTDDYGAGDVNLLIEAKERFYSLLDAELAVQEKTLVLSNE